MLNRFCPSALRWADDIEENWPHIEDQLSYSNIFTGLIKLAFSFLNPIYGAMKLYEKATTNRNVLFKTSREKTIHRLEDLSAQIDNTETKLLKIEHKM